MCTEIWSIYITIFVYIYSPLKMKKQDIKQRELFMSLKSTLFSFSKSNYKLSESSTDT